MILHDYYRSSTSYRLRIALNLKGPAYERSPVNLRTGEHRQEAYLNINPFGTVPALQVGDKIHYQSLALLDWLEATYPDPSFLPSAAEARQSCLELYYAVASEIHAVNNLPILNYLKSEFGAGTDALEAWHQTWVHRTFSPVEEALTRLEWANPSLPFGQPTLFEIVLVPQIYNARRWNTDLSPFPLLSKLDDTCSDIEAFRLAHPDIQSDAPGDA